MKPVPQQPNISLSQTSGLLCEECSNNTFIEVVFLRAISKFVSLTPKDAIMPIPAFSCSKCGHVNDQFNPTKQIGDVQD